MKHFSLTLILTLILLRPAPAEETGQRSANTVILDAVGVKNLRIETLEVEESDFEESVFALGRIEVLPGNNTVVSTRISGRVHSLLARPDVLVDKGDELLWIESRQPGDPPPVIRVEAPMSGLISEVNIATGQPVSPETSLLEIVDLSTVEAAASVPEFLAGKLQPGQAAHIRVAAAGDTVYQAELVHLGTLADSTSGTLEAAFHVPNPDNRLRPGMRAEFSIVLSTREGVTSVPRSALQGEGANRFVYVKDFDLPNAFVKTAVETGQFNDQSVEILSGLLPGDEVVTRGGYSLAFAGGGSISLKEALDAAHGHEHAQDGSELSAKGAKKSAAAGGPGDEQGEEPAAGPFWKIVSGILAVLLLLSSVRRHSGAGDGTKSAKPSTGTIA